MILALWENPAVVGLIVGAPMAILGALGWWRSRGMDAAAKQTATETLHAGRVAEVIAGLQSIINNLKDDNEELRDNLKDCDLRIEALRKRIDALYAEIRELRAENGRSS